MVDPRDHRPEEEDEDVVVASSPTRMTTMFKLLVASALLYSAVSTYRNNSSTGRQDTMTDERRRLTSTVVGDGIPSYMDGLMKDLRERKKLFEDTPPEEVKYWFEYSGPLQVGFGFKQ
jgi:hypothetical protein